MRVHGHQVLKLQLNPHKQVNVLSLNLIGAIPLCYQYRGMFIPSINTTVMSAIYKVI